METMEECRRWHPLRDDGTMVYYRILQRDMRDGRMVEFDRPAAWMAGVWWMASLGVPTFVEVVG
jgi:hypothetical protein